MGQHQREDLEEGVGDQPPAEVVGVRNAEDAAPVLPDPGVENGGGLRVGRDVEHGHHGGGEGG